MGLVLFSKERRDVHNRAQPNKKGETSMNLWKNEEGQGMVEYGLIIALVAVVVIVGLTLLGGKANNLFGNISNKLTVS